MSRIKLLFLLLPLAINVKSVEIINKSHGPGLSESRWYENSSATPYGNTKENATHVLVQTLDSPKNFSPIPLRIVPKPISYGSYGIPKVIHITPMPQQETKYYSADPLSEKYSVKVSGAPLRSVSTQPPAMKREEPTLRDDVDKADPKEPHINNMAQKNPRNEIRENDSSSKQNHILEPLPQARSIGREIRIVESTSSAPLRPVPKPYVIYEGARVKEFVTHPPLEDKLVNISRMPLVSEPTLTVLFMKHNEEEAFKKTEKPKVNVEIVEVNSKPMTTPVYDRNRFVEHISAMPIETMSDAPRFSSLTVLPTTVTVMDPTESPSTITSIMEPPQTDMIISNSTMSTMQQTVKELRLDFTCDGIDAFYGIIKNCDKFVECKDDVAKLYRCPPGLHFNPKTVWPAEPCEDKYIVGCDKTLTPTTPKRSLIIITHQIEHYNCVKGDGYYDHESNCGLFIECKNNVATLYGCPWGWHFNNDTRYGENPCDIPATVQCQKPEPKFSATIVSRRVADYVCSSSSGYFKINNECEYFIKCERWIASSYKCFAGLQFNQHALWGNDPCARASEIRCQAVIPPAPKFSAVLVGRMADYHCQSSNGYYKINDECEQFIKCEHSIASTYKCFPGLQYNHNAAWGEDPCASESVIRCRGKIIPLEPKFSAILIGRIESYICPTSRGYYKHGDNCEEFIKCERAIAYSYKCLSGLQFNHHATWGEDPCASESIILCHATIIPPPPKFSAVLIAKIENYICPSSNGYYRIDNDCEQFIKCERSIASQYKCLSGLQYNHNAVWGMDPCASETIIRCRAKILPPEPKFSANLIGRLEGYICPSSQGYFILENDCEQFIKCERSVAMKFKCYSGMQFNHNAEWGQDPCASESIIRCHAAIIPPAPTFSAILIARMEDYVCSSSSGYFKLENDCEQFIKCERSVASKYKCFNGLQYNHNAVWGQDPCASESIVRCHAKIIPPAPKFSAVLISRMENYVCPSSNGYFGLENDCEQFIKCERSVSLKFKCLSGMQFNHNAEWGQDPCASESIIRCHAVIIPPAPTFSAVLIARMENYVCSSSSGYFKLENDCEQFIKCERSVASKYKCFNGLQYNHNAVWGQDPCASESIVRCHAKIIPPAPKFSAVLISRMENYVCPSSNGYFGLENDCEQFIKCERSVSLKFKCLSGMQFNHNAEWGQDPCASESIIRCHAVIIPPAPTFSAVLIARTENYVCSSSNGYFKLENDCEQFIKCERSVASKYKCFNGLQYNHNAVWGQDPCASESIVRCHAKIIPPAPKFSAVLISRMENYVCPSSNGYFGLENDCEQFIKCERSIAMKFKCYSGMQFNHNAAWGQDPCARESIIRCHAAIIPPAPTFSAVLIARMENYVCSSSSGYFKLENDCEQFIKCERSVASKYKCFNGLQYNHNAVWGQDPCASELIIRCHAVIIPPAPTFSAVLIARMENYVCSSSSGYFKLENDCEQFIKCERSVASKYKCFNGLQYNHNAVWEQDPCASESIVRCHAKIIPPAPTFSAVLISRMENYVCPSSNGYFGLENDCEQFIKCERSVSLKFKCFSGTQFNHNAAWGQDPCANESIIRCRAVVILPAPTFSAVLIARMENYVCSSSSGYFKLENDCEQFIKCEHSVASKYKCFNGLQYNHNAVWEQDPCASESIVRCHAKIIPPAPTFSAVLISRMENYVCPSSNGYFGLENDCEQFIKCERSVSLKFKCFSGTQFNHNAAWGQDPCANESIIRCRAVVIPPAPKFSAIFIARLDGYVCPSSTGYYRVADNCEQFIKCERSVASTYKCYPGLQYNHNVAWGEDPCASESIIRCRPAPKFSASLIIRLEKYVCPAGNGYYRLATNDCEQFVKCENSLASSYKCYTGLQFNQNARWGEDPCALPAIARCEIEVVTPAILITPHIDHYTCAIANGYFGKPDECEQFIECKRNVPSLYKCPAGLQFNPKARWGENPCASAFVVRCQVKILSYTLISKYVTGYTCPAPTGYYKVKDQCEQFIMCQDNIPSLYMCKNGLHFNRFVAWGADPCAIKSVARCEHYKPKTPIDHDALCPHANGYFPLDDTECSKYVVCENGIATIMPCPSGLVFNATLEACDWPVNVPSCNPNVFEGFICPPPMARDGTSDEEITHFRYGQSCKAYIACQEGRPRLLSCDRGRHFDEQTRHCIDSSLVHNCKED